MSSIVEKHSINEMRWI